MQRGINSSDFLIRFLSPHTDQTLNLLENNRNFCFWYLIIENCLAHVGSILSHVYELLLRLPIRNGLASREKQVPGQQLAEIQPKPFYSVMSTASERKQERNLHRLRFGQSDLLCNKQKALLSNTILLNTSMSHNPARMPFIWRVPS